MTPTGDSDGSSSEDPARVGTIDHGHLLLVGAGRASDLAVARRFASEATE